MLRCTREPPVPLLSGLSSVTPERHCCRVSTADKGDHRPDSVALYSGCTPGKRLAWFLPDDRHTAFIVGLCGGWRHARMKSFMDPNMLCPGKSLVLTTNINIDEIATNARFVMLSLPNGEMS
ncbi:uncharacterized protein TNCV_2108391 [Trichonephila clavipes]|nr:uncharacterized protein TNCV_2108391 [Trichonephila clavipes]